MQIRTALALALVIIVASTLRFQQIIKFPTLEHDEAISYLAATGNEGAYQEVVDKKSYPYADWATAEQWQKFLKPHEGFIFQNIQTDLVNHDIHPPLYFWLLHLWILIVGVHVWTGPSLNVIIDILNTALLFFFARTLLKDDFKAFAVGISFSFSPGLMSVTFLARSYELFTFFSILLLWALRRLLFCEKKSLLLSGFFVSCIVFLGLLTHYYFGLFAGGAVIAFAIYGLLIKKGVPWFWKKMLTLTTSSGFGFLLMILVHPGFFQQFFSFKLHGQPFTGFDLLLRVMKTGLAVSGYFVEVERRGAPRSSMIFLILLFILIVVSFIISKRNINSKPKENLITNDQILYIFIYGAIVFLSIVILYVSFFSEQAVMGPRYLTPIFPIFSFIPVLYFNKFSIYKRISLFIFIILMLVSGTLYANPWKVYHADKKIFIDNSENMIIDNTKRGVLLVYMFHIPSNKPVYCAMQDDLLQNLKWKDKLTEKTLYLSEISYGNTVEKRKKFLYISEPEYVARFTTGGKWGIYGLGQLYEFKKDRVL